MAVKTTKNSSTVTAVPDRKYSLSKREETIKVILGIAEFLRNTKYTSPSGKCVDASIELQQALFALGIKCKKVGGTFDGLGHTWLLVWISSKSRAKILDITLDQFGDYPKIVFDFQKNYPGYGRK